MNLPQIVFSVVLATVVAFAARAQNLPPEAPGGDLQEGAIAMPEIVVVGDKVGRSAENAIARKREAPNTITVIEAEQLNQFGDQPLGDAMRRLPGVTFSAANRAREVQLRGIGREYTQTLVNGRPLADTSTSRAVQVDRIPSSLVERVEIIRSPLASQDGQGAAGTLNIVLKNQNFTPRTELGGGAGWLEDNGAIADGTLLHADQYGAIRYILMGGVQRQLRNESADIFTFDNAGSGAGGELGINERTYNQVNLVPAFELQLGDQDVVRFEPSYLYTEEIRFDSEADLEDDHVTLGRTENEDRERVRRNLGLKASWRHEFPLNSDMTFDIDAQSAREDTKRDAVRFNADGTINRVRQRTQDKSLKRFNPALQVNHRFGAHEVSWGGDFSLATREEDNSSVTNDEPDTPNNSNIFQVEERRWNGFAQNVYRMNPSTIVTFGLRLEQSSTETTDFAGFSSNSSGLFALPSAHVVYRVLPQIDIRLGLARTLRRPDLGELSPTVTLERGSLGRPDMGGNAGLTPESIWGADAGIAYYLGDAGIVGINLFVRDFVDKIETVTEMEGERFVARPQNTGNGRMYGIELEGRLPLIMTGLSDLHLWGNATHAPTKLETPDGDQRPFNNQHDYVANIGLDWFLSRWRATFGINANWTSGYDQTITATDDSFVTSKLRSLTRVDLSVRADLTDDISLSLSALNMLAPTEERTDSVFDANGGLVSRSEESEDTYRSYYARMSWKF